MTVLSPTKIVRAALIAVAIGGTTLTAVPAQAQSNPSIEFRFGVPGFGFHFDTRRHGGRFCISNDAVRRDLRRAGYSDIRFLDRRGRIVAVYAERGRNAYRIVYDTCRRAIVDRTQLRRDWRWRWR